MKLMTNEYGLFIYLNRYTHLINATGPASSNFKASVNKLCPAKAKQPKAIARSQCSKVRGNWNTPIAMAHSPHSMTLISP